MDETTKDKPNTEAMGSLEVPEVVADPDQELTQRESFGTDQTAPHQAVTNSSEVLSKDRTLQATPTPVGARATRREGGPEQDAPTSMGQDRDASRADLDAKIRKRMAESEAKSKTDPLIGKEFGGRFTVMSKVGEGGMGAVYRARQRGMDRDVAIKVLLGELARNETVVKRFHLEALAVSKLRHPNTIQIFDFGETDDGLLYIAMEFLDGKSLHEVLQEERVLSARRALKIAQQIAKSLREAHAKGIVHRDLKPDNIFLCTVGEELDFVKVLDFGVAKLRDGDGPGKDLTKTGTIFGTPKYMSPEQARAGAIDARSDLYAIGIILYEMLTGRAPFNADNSLSILIQHIQEPVPGFDEVQPDLVFPEPVVSLCYRLLAKRAVERPQTAEALIREAQTVLEGLEDIYRNVLTRAEAVEIGLELAMMPRTRHDTVLNSTNTQGAPTEGPFRQPTVAIEAEEATTRRWPVLVLVVALGLIGMSTAVVYASMPALPVGYLDLEKLTTQEVGKLPTVELEMVTVAVFAQPSGIEIEGLPQPVKDNEKFNITLPLGSDPLEVTFKKEGYETLTTNIQFNERAPEPVLIQLTVAREAPRPVSKTPARRTPRRSSGKSGGNKTAATTPIGVTAPAIATPVTTPVVVAPPVTTPVVVAPPVTTPVVVAPPVVTKPKPKPKPAKLIRLPANPRKVSKLKSVKLKPGKLKSPLKLKGSGKLK